jgi:hypothetical protein
MLRKSTKPKPTPGHKCQGANFGVRVSCQCGWRSATWYGQGARSNAYGEWQGHVAQHAKRRADDFLCVVCGGKIEGLDFHFVAERMVHNRCDGERV